MLHSTFEGSFECRTFVYAPVQTDIIRNNQYCVTKIFGGYLILAVWQFSLMSLNKNDAIQQKFLFNQGLGLPI